MNKTALVTGASSGIGEATVRRILTGGYRVFAGARRQDRIAPRAALGATLLPVDLTDDASRSLPSTRSRRKAAASTSWSTIRYGSYGALEDLPLDEARRQFAVNVFAWRASANWSCR